MTSQAPTPQPQTTPSPAPSGLLGSILSEVGSSGTTKAPTDLYGLGEWGTQTINPGDLPILTAIIGSGQATTGNAIMAAFAQADPASQATIQRALYLGGYYSSKTYTPTYGVIKPQDMTAFGSALVVAGKTTAPLSGVLLSGAQYGITAGVTAAQQNAKAATAKIELPNVQTLEADAMSAFQQVLGRKATPSEAAAFAAQYRAMSAGTQRAANQALYDTKTGGLTQSQETGLQGELAQVGEPVTPGSATSAENDFPWVQGGGATPGSATSAENDQQQGFLDSQQSPYESNDFGSEMNDLGSIAQQAQAQAIPGATGLSQVTVNDPEDPTAAAENFAENADPKAAAGTDLAGQFHNLLSILGSSTGGA